MTTINIKELETLCLSVLTKAGLSQKDAQITVDHYLENELSGKTSHGMVRVVQAASFIEEVGLPEKAPFLANDKDSFAILDGQMNIAPVVGKMMLDESIKQTKEHGISFVGVRNYFGNTGSMTYYLKRLANQNLVAFMSCNSVATVAAPKGKQKLVGTNPIGLGVPSNDGHHFIADFATSAIAYGKVLVARDKGEPLPEGLIIDKDGNPSTSPDDAFPNGAILPLADYRGFSLALFVEMLALMIGGKALKDEMHGEDGLFILAMDPDYIDNHDYASHVSDILTQIRQSPTASGYDEVTIPGDRAATNLKEALQNGEINVADKTLEDLNELAK